MAKRRRPNKAPGPAKEPFKPGEFLLDNLLWLAGAALYAAALQIFALPSHIAQSGVSGVAIIVNYLTGAPIGVMNFLLNVPLIALAWVFIGWRFVSKTLWVTAVLSVLLELLGRWSALPRYEGDPMLAALLCGALSGAGLGLVFLRGATTGGTDIVGRLLRLAFPHVSIGQIILGVDAAVVLASALVFKNVESALYAAISIFVSARVVDFSLYGTRRGKMLTVFTDKAQEIAAAITSQTPRGVSILPVTGGYTGAQKHMLVCVVQNSEVHKMLKIIRAVDENTFTAISDASAIWGKGFKPPGV
jgi:uncharacterized membrane-anchored protein YitT (DUF2179 family)